MDIVQLYAAHPFWIWLALGVLLLAVEGATGSGWLLWPAASAGVVAVITLLGLHLGAPIEFGVFAILTVLTTFVARKWLVHAPKGHPDINDAGERLIGKTGDVTTAFIKGKGRALIANAEWAAILDNGGDLPVGAHVKVVAVDGAQLKVQAA